MSFILALCIFLVNMISFVSVNYIVGICVSKRIKFSCNPMLEL